MRLRPENLERYVAMTRGILIAVARTGGTITYSELTREMNGPGRGYIGHVLKEVCRREHGHGRPLLGALVVLSQAGHPGGGFWNPSPKDRFISHEPKQSQMSFWQGEREKVYKHWKKPAQGIRQEKER